MLGVVYLVFTEGHTATSGEHLVRVDLCDEAVRLARLLRELLPDEGEVAGLLALLLLTDARRATRVDADGDLVLLADQDRTRWDRAAIDEGAALVAEALRRSAGSPGPYQLQAAIAACHATSPTFEATDWRQIAELYRLLEERSPSPVVSLNRAVAVGERDGPAAGLDAGRRDRRARALPPVARGPGRPAPAPRPRRRERRGLPRRPRLRGSAAERRFLDRRLAEVSAAL